MPASDDLTTPADVPTNWNEVSLTIQDSLLEIWAAFIAHVPYLVMGMALLLASWMLISLVNLLLGRGLQRSKLRESLCDLIQRLVSIALWTVSLLLVAMIVFPGLTPTKALGGLGLVSVAIGLAFKDIFENFFAGILILWRFPFENGDFIECEDVVGRVEKVTVRMTQIRRVSGELIVMPNAILFKNPVEVLTAQQSRRVRIMTGIAYSESIDEAVALIQQAVESCRSIKSAQPVEVFPAGFGSSSIDIEVCWWTDPKPLDIRRSRGEVITAIKRALDDAGIEIPFPYRTLTFKDPLALAGGQTPNGENS